MGTPEIQCTVIEVLETTEAFGTKKFPRIYDSISNDRVRSVFEVTGKTYPKAKIKQIKKSESYEEIQIVLNRKHLILKIKGKPISRQGSLEHKNKTLARVTCH